MIISKIRHKRVRQKSCPSRLSTNHKRVHLINMSFGPINALNSVKVQDFKPWALKVCLICINKCAKIQTNWANASWDIERNHEIKYSRLAAIWNCRPDPKNILKLCLIRTNKCAKLQINCLKASWDMEQKRKSKMAAWRPS